MEFNGVYAYLSEAFMSADDFATLPAAQQILYESRPHLGNCSICNRGMERAYGMYSFVTEKKMGEGYICSSLFGILLQQLYHFFLSNTFEVMGPSAIFLPILIIIFGSSLVIFANLAIKKNWGNLIFKGIDILIDISICSHYTSP